MHDVCPTLVRVRSLYLFAHSKASEFDLVDLCGQQPPTYLQLLLVRKATKCETFACSNIVHTLQLQRAIQPYIDVHGVWHIQGASYNESHYTVWTAWISVELIKVRVDFVFQSLALLISAQSQCMAANTSGL